MKTLSYLINLYKHLFLLVHCEAQCWNSGDLARLSNYFDEFYLHLKTIPHYQCMNLLYPCQISVSTSKNWKNSNIGPIHRSQWWIPSLSHISVSKPSHIINALIYHIHVKFHCTQEQTKNKSMLTTLSIGHTMLRSRDFCNPLEINSLKVENN